ncbi:hypothetical protein ACJMK2_028693 [Sinanodonta woodiana]|uniref:ETS domain-containing protein n=1 Tax=Sinanodonta woodiana TaxID=1069815 RepID=A0ABD3XBR7_SINWO
MGTFLELCHKTQMEDTDLYLSSFDLDVFTQNVANSISAPQLTDENMAEALLESFKAFEEEQQRIHIKQDCAEDTASVSNVSSPLSEHDCMQHFGECLSPSSQGYSPTEQPIVKVPSTQSYLEENGSYQMSKPVQTMGENRGSFGDVTDYHCLENAQPGFPEPARTEFYPGYHQPVPKNMCTRGQFLPIDTHTHDAYFNKQAFHTVPTINYPNDWQQQTHLRHNVLTPCPNSFTQVNSPNNMSGQNPEGNRSFPAQAFDFTGSGPLQLWQFLLKLLTDNTCQHFISWTGDGWEFKLLDPNEVARRWGIQKNNKNIIHKTAGKRYVYRFVCDIQSLLGYAPDQLFNACHLRPQKD